VCTYGASHGFTNRKRLEVPPAETVRPFFHLVRDKGIEEIGSPCHKSVPRLDHHVQPVGSAMPLHVKPDAGNTVEVSVPVEKTS
jgi:hypothetical protein